MTSERARAKDTFSFSKLINLVLWYLHAPKVHDYTRYKHGADYVFDSADNETSGCMTGQRRGIKPGHHILIRVNEVPERYEIMAIDYYASPPDLWVASLSKLRVVKAAFKAR